MCVDSRTPCSSGAAHTRPVTVRPVDVSGYMLMHGYMYIIVVSVLHMYYVALTCTLHMDVKYLPASRQLVRRRRRRVGRDGWSAELVPRPGVGRGPTRDSRPNSLRSRTQ